MRMGLSTAVMCLGGHACRANTQHSARAGWSSLNVYYGKDISIAGGWPALKC